MPISSLADQTILTQYHHNGPGSNGTVTRLVIHATVSPCANGGAVNNARYFQSPNAGGAAHYIVDPSTIVCSVDEDNKAAHAPPNAGSIGIELCDPQAGDSARWSDANHQAMLAKVGPLVVDICSRHGLPLVWLSSQDLLNGATGITGHVEVAQAWHQSDHSDPGDMPIDMFMGFVSPQPSPHPTPLPEDEVTGTYVLRNGARTVCLLLSSGVVIPVTSFADIEEMMKTTKVQFVDYSATTSIADANGTTRNVWVVGPGPADMLKLPTA